jgi:hypothetical protein
MPTFGNHDGPWLISLLSSRLNSAPVFVLVQIKFEHLNTTFLLPEAVYLVMCDPSMNNMWAT